MVGEVGVGCWCHPHGPCTHPGFLVTPVGSPRAQSLLYYPSFLFWGGPSCHKPQSSIVSSPSVDMFNTPFLQGFSCLLCQALYFCLMSPVLLRSPPEALFDNLKAAMKCLSPPAFPALAARGRHFSQSTRVWETECPFRTLWTAPSCWLCLPSPGFLAMPFFLCVTCPKRNNSISTVLGSAGTFFGLPVSTLNSLKAAPWLVTQGAGHGKGHTCLLRGPGTRPVSSL